MADIRPTIGLPPDETVQFFRPKGYALTTRWDQLLHEEHGRAFTVSKLLNGDLLERVRASLDDVVAKGGTFAQWRSGILPELQRAGWWGKVENADLTGTEKPVFIGDARLRTIYGTNLRMSRAAGKWKRVQALKAGAPFLMYVAIRDGHTRPLHRLWGGLDNGAPIILPVDHPCWSMFFPPNGWGCRCSVIQLTQRDLDRRGLKVTTDEELMRRGWLTATGAVGGALKRWRRSNGAIESAPAGIDPGFAYNPGEDFLTGLTAPAPDAPISRPRIAPDTKPELPPVRERPADIVIPTDTPIDQVIRRFHSHFDGPSDGITTLDVDRIDEPIVIDDNFFYRGGRIGDPAALKLDPGRIAYIDLLAEALKDPDEIWWVWEEGRKQPDGSTRSRLMRRYIARFSVAGQERQYMIVMQFGEGGWQGVTAFRGSDPAYLDRFRGGVLAYRRPE